jgi:hypothetical protein
MTLYRGADAKEIRNVFQMKRDSKLKVFLGAERKEMQRE